MTPDPSTEALAAKGERIASNLTYEPSYEQMEEAVDVMLALAARLSQAEEALRLLRTVSHPSDLKIAIAKADAVLAASSAGETPE